MPQLISVNIKQSWYTMTNLIDYNQITSQISIIILTHFKFTKCSVSNVDNPLPHAYSFKGNNHLNKDGNVSGDGDNKQNSLDDESEIKPSQQTKKTRKPSKRKRTSSDTFKTTRKPRRTVPTTTRHPRLDTIPKMMIFETDRLLWPFRYETDVTLPYDLVQPTAWPIPEGGKGQRWCTGNFGGRELVDGNGKCLQLNYDALVLFYKLKNRGVKLSLVATIQNSSKSDGMRQLIRLFEFDYVITYMEVDERSPTDHVKTIKENSGLEFRDLVYFGINKTVLEDIDKELKVITIYVDPDKGLDINDVQEGGRLYAIRPHVPGPNEKPLTVGKIVSNEEAANIYGPEVMNMEERSEGGSVISSLYTGSNEEKSESIPDININSTLFNL